MKVLQLSALFLVLGLTRQLSAQGEAINLAGVELTLGTPQDSVLARLAERYTVRSVGESWVVTSKEGPPYTFYGSVSFVNHRLSGVAKAWGPTDQQQGYEFADALYGAVAALVAEGRSLCSIAVEQKQEPTLEAKTLRLICGGGRSLEISVIKTSETGPTGSITEMLKINR